MLRAPTVATLMLLAALAPTAAHASERAPRVAIAPFADEVGLDPLALSDMIVGLRGVALEEEVDVVDLSTDAAGGEGCDLACLGELADQLGADYLLTGLSGRREGLLTLTLELRPVRDGEVGDVADQLMASAPDTATLVRGTERAGRTILGRLHAPAPPVETAVRRPARRPARPDVYHQGVVQWDERSTGLAIGLEILFPGAGLVYAGDWGAAGLEYLGIFTGFVLVISSVATTDDGSGHVDGMGMTMGVLLLLGSRIYGIVRAPAAAESYNRASRRAWEESRGAELRGLRLRAPEVGLAAPAYTAFALPALSF